MHSLREAMRHRMVQSTIRVIVFAAVGTGVAYWLLKGPLTSSEHDRSQIEIGRAISEAWSRAGLDDDSRPTEDRYALLFVDPRCRACGDVFPIAASMHPELPVYLVFDMPQSAALDSFLIATKLNHLPVRYGMGSLSNELSIEFWPTAIVVEADRIGSIGETQLTASAALANVVRDTSRIYLIP